MKTIVFVRMVLFSAFVVSPIIGRTDIAPLSFEEWRGKGCMQFFFEESKPVDSHSGFWKLSDDCGFSDKWFYSGLIVLLVFFVFAALRDIRRCDRYVLGAFAMVTVSAVVVSHHSREHGWFIGVVLLIAEAQMLMLIATLVFWIRNQFSPRHGRICLCTLILQLALGASIVEEVHRQHGGGVVNQISEYEVGQIGDVSRRKRIDLPPPTDEERKAYERYLWERRHCTRCGSSLKYHQGWHCPKCHPESLNDPVDVDNKWKKCYDERVGGIN